MELRDVLSKIEEVFVFYLNSEWCSKNDVKFEKAEKEYYDILNTIKEWKQDRDYYFNKLTDIKDLVVCNEEPLAKQIVEVLDD
jgi:hypothetical protein